MAAPSSEGGVVGDRRRREVAGRSAYVQAYAASNAQSGPRAPLFVNAQESLSLLRRGLLVLLVIGAAGLIGELVLLEHYEDTLQFVPFGLLTLTLLVTAWHWVSGSRTSLRALQAVMLLLVVAGPIGIFLHLRGNFEMEREFDPSLLGLDLWTAVIRGEAPTLAPGTLVQFGLLGLLYAYKHPALSSKDP